MRHADHARQARAYRQVLHRSQWRACHVRSLIRKPLRLLFPTTAYPKKRPLVYLSWYTVMLYQTTLQDVENAYLTCSRLLRGVFIANGDRAYGTIGGYGGNHTHARTAGDHRRLLF
ncbi:hypothetical protein F4821DRAFT_247759 [Hypoxylon rubiginosum]|uniref:Uncharacterized protein n=1 Tax=Hypoxylon rubiginosum TaxID=110542 RepID=A0ACC0CPA3_9PEZI|nr:hypothetical protein F4821DRAFT_247759 [Hypoxylon rubiginosum]